MIGFVVLAAVFWLLIVAARRRYRIRHRIPPSSTLEYQTHIRSAEWHATCARLKAEAGYRCTWRHWFRCRNRRRLSVHHWTYAHLGDERDDELQVLCPRHHAQADMIRRRRAS